MIAALIYGHRDTGLEGSWTVCPFSEIIAVASPLGLVSSPALGSRPDLHSWHALSSADPLNILAVLAPMDLSYHASYGGSQGSQLSDTTDEFPLRCLHSSFQYCES